MSMVVGPVGFSGDEPQPARTTRGYLGRYGAAMPGNERPTDAAQGGPDGGDPDVRSADPEDAMMERFLSDYRSLMPGRLASISDFIDRLRYEEARVAILSLESASGMIGEPRLRGLLHDLRTELDTATDERRETLRTAIEVESGAVRERLHSA